MLLVVVDVVWSEFSLAMILFIDPKKMTLKYSKVSTDFPKTI